MNNIIHTGNFECFMDVYKEKLIEALDKHPNDYAWDKSELDTVLSRMRIAIEKGTFNKESHAFKATCKELKIKHTYKAIREFISL